MPNITFTTVLATLAIAATIAAPGYSATITSADRLDERIEAAWIEGEARERGIDAASVREQIAQQAALSVTPEQVEAYVDAHPRTLPAEHRVRILEAANRARAQAARNAIERGVTWRVTAAKYKATITVTTSTPTTRLGRAIARAPRHRLTRYGTHVFKVLKTTPPRPMPRKEQQAKAWELLASQAQRDALTAFRAKWRARTTCAPEFAAHPNCGP